MGKKILVTCGAGISTLVIPDFRSPNELYNSLKDEIKDPEKELFTLKTTQEKPELIKKVVGSFLGHQPQVPHQLLKRLEGDIWKIYTQNIDGLEQKAGIDPNKLVYVHGSLMLPWKCMVCSRESNFAGESSCEDENCDGKLRVI